MSKALRYDEIGYWSEIKLEILKKYATAYSTILSKQKTPKLHHIYVDAFAGAGKHISKTTGEFVFGSPSNALAIEPPFKEYHLIDLDSAKVEALYHIAEGRNDTYIYEGDCNEILCSRVFPKADFQKYRRALCILDPYGLHLDWSVIQKAGQMKSIDIFLNFPVADMNRNVLWRNPKNVPNEQKNRMNRFWGDESWKDVVYVKSRQMSLFGDHDSEKVSNDTIAEAFRNRLKTKAKFGCVPKPIAMRNTQNAIVYYLFFATQKSVANHIVKDIFKKYENKRG